MQIQPNERDKIAVWFSKGLSIREIGRRLGRHHTVISRELKRNRFKNNYVAIQCPRVSGQRKSRTNKTHPQKSPWIYSYVLEKLGQGWSPEQISGRLKLKHGRSIIHWETIYRWIYDPKLKDKKTLGILAPETKEEKEEVWKESSADQDTLSCFYSSQAQIN